MARGLYCKEPPSYRRGRKYRGPSVLTAGEKSKATSQTPVEKVLPKNYKRSAAIATLVSAASVVNSKSKNGSVVKQTTEKDPSEKQHINIDDKDISGSGGGSGDKEPDDDEDDDSEKLPEVPDEIKDIRDNGALSLGGRFRRLNELLKGNKYKLLTITVKQLQ